MQEVDRWMCIVDSAADEIRLWIAAPSVVEHCGKENIDHNQQAQHSGVEDLGIQRWLISAGIEIGPRTWL